MGAVGGSADDEAIRKVSTVDHLRALACYLTLLFSNSSVQHISKSKLKDRSIRSACMFQPYLFPSLCAFEVQ